MAILATGFAPAGSRAQLLGPEFQVNTYTTGAQSRPQVAASPAGEFVVTWASAGQDGSGSGIFGQRFDAADSPMGTEFLVNQYTTEDESDPQVAMDGGGSFVVVWSNFPSRRTLIQGRRYDATGQPQGGEFQVNSYTTLQSAWVRDVTADEAGNFVVLWSYHTLPPLFEAIGGSAQRFDAGGQPVGDPAYPGAQILVDAGVGPGVDRVAATGPGEFVISWRPCHSLSPWELVCDDAAVRRYDTAGSVGAAFQVNTSTTLAVYPEVDLAGDPAGNFVVVWRAQEPYTGVNDAIFGRRVDAAGSPIGAEFRVNSYTTSQPQIPAVAADRQGNFLVVWSAGGIFGQRFAADGSRIGGEFQVNTYDTGGPNSPSVAAGNVGDFVVSWQSDVRDGSGSGVFARRVRSSVFWGDFEPGDSCAWSAVVGGSCP